MIELGDKMLDAFCEYRPDDEQHQTVPFTGDVYLYPTMEPPQGQYLLWMLCELNFRMDLLLLDLHLMVETCRMVPWAENKMQEARVRRKQVFGVWNAEVAGAAPVLWENTRPTDATKGWGNVELAARLPLLRNFYDLMKTWPGTKPPGFHSFPPSEKYEGQLVLRWEQTLIRYFCLTFFQTFGRLPVIPHTLNSEHLNNQAWDFGLIVLE
jgi:hypothetical protein